MDELRLSIVSVIDSFGAHGGLILLYFIGAIVAGTLGAGVQNKVKGDDIIKCGKLGMVGGAVSGVVGIIVYVLAELIKGGSL